MQQVLSMRDILGKGNGVQTETHKNNPRVFCLGLFLKILTRV